MSKFNYDFAEDPETCKGCIFLRNQDGQFFCASASECWEPETATEKPSNYKTK